MVKRLREKMNTMLEARKENKNKGFTLVELIVVIVILAILIGVTIGGVYAYVNKSRVNTDINNASTIQSTLSTLSTKASLNGSAFKDKEVTIKWTDAVSDVGSATWSEDNATLKTEVGNLLTDGFPASKTQGEFTVTIKWDAKGNFSSVKCVNANATEPQE